MGKRKRADDEDEAGDGVDTCPICGKDQSPLSRDGLWWCCDVCSKWFHPRCAGASKGEIEQIQGKIEAGVKVEWSCPRCAARVGERRDKDKPAKDKRKKVEKRKERETAGKPWQWGEDERNRQPVHIERISAVKRKRDALNTVCDKMGGLQLSDSRGRSEDARLTFVRSKSILKKTATRVRFARTRTSSDFVMFDETNILEVQTCLHPDEGLDVDMDRSTPRSVMVFQDPNNSDDASTDPHSPSNTMGNDTQTRDGDPPLSKRAAYQDPQGIFGGGLEDAHDTSMGCESSRAKRGRIRQHEIEEGKKFRDMLAQMTKEDSGDDRRGSTTPADNHSFTLGTSPARQQIVGLGGLHAVSPAQLSTESPAAEDCDCLFRLGSPSTPSRKKDMDKDPVTFGSFERLLSNPPPDHKPLRADRNPERNATANCDGSKSSKAPEGFKFDAPNTQLL